MLRIMWKLFLIFLCGYLLIEWFPITYPFHLSDILVGPIIYPLEFFASLIALFVGLVVSVQLFQEILQGIIKLVKKIRSKH